MQKYILITAGIALMGALSGCGNAAMERKLEKLENRVEQLENNGRATTPMPQPVAETTPEPTGPLGSFDFPETSHDFGTIEEGTVAEHTFEFTNTGEAPLIIANAQGSCGCTVPSYPKEPIAPGAKAKILVKFNSQGRTGNQQKFVSLTANTYPSITRLSIKAVVNPAEGAAPAE